MSTYSVVMTALPNPEAAARLGRALVEEQLAACANLVPGVRSIYRWQGKLCEEPETLVILKTRAELFDALKSRAAALHPYECPELIRLDISDGHPPYLDWIGANTRVP
jgi:periplasmic divalent cation tolerance protein